MDKTFILSEIKRTAADNGGVALGRQRFAAVTGIKQIDWYGKYWSRWGDALVEAGFAPNELQGSYDDAHLVEQLALLAKELGRFPVSGELRMKARSDQTFPSHNAFERLGPKSERAAKVLAYCKANGLEDVAAICEPIAAVKQPEERLPINCETPTGFVYLARMGKFYKIGQTASLGRRQYELSIQLPEKLTLVHSITTDDPAGIEAYWHRRFDERRKNGEWFELSADDVRAFKRRKMM